MVGVAERVLGIWVLVVGAVPIVDNLPLALWQDIDLVQCLLSSFGMDFQEGDLFGTRHVCPEQLALYA